MVKFLVLAIHRTGLLHECCIQFTRIFIVIDFYVEGSCCLATRLGVRQLSPNLTIPSTAERMAKK